MGLFSRSCAGACGGGSFALLFEAAAGGPGPDARPAFALLDVESFRLAYEVDEFAVAVGADVEIGKQVGQLRADLPQRNPSVFAFDLRNRLSQHRDRGAPGPQRPSLGGRIGADRCSCRHQILGVDKPSARLPETLGRLLGAKPVNVGALLAHARGKAGEIAV